MSDNQTGLQVKAERTQVSKLIGIGMTNDNVDNRPIMQIVMDAGKLFAFNPKDGFGYEIQVDDQKFAEMLAKALESVNKRFEKLEAAAHVQKVERQTYNSVMKDLNKKYPSPQTSEDPTSIEAKLDRVIEILEVVHWGKLNDPMQPVAVKLAELRENQQ